MVVFRHFNAEIHTYHIFKLSKIAVKAKANRTGLRTDRGGERSTLALEFQLGWPGLEAG